MLKFDEKVLAEIRKFVRRIDVGAWSTYIILEEERDSLDAAAAVAMTCTACSGRLSSFMTTKDLEGSKITLNFVSP